MTRANRIDWLIFFALGFIWGSSYLFIKLAVDDFGTFTLVALRLVVGAILLWIVVRIAKQPLPRERRIYGHLLVMAVINITIPFLLITWAEQTVESSLAAILTSPVPLFAIVLSALFLHDEPMRVNGLVGLVVGFVGVVIVTSRGLDRRRVVVGRRDRAARRDDQLRRGRGLLPPQRPRPAADDPRGLPGDVRRGDHRRRSRSCSSTLGPPRPTARRSSRSCGSGILGSGLAYLFVFRLFAHWGATRTTLVAYLIPVVGIVLGYLVLAEPIDARLIIGTALVIAGIGLVNSRFGRRRLFGRAATGRGDVAGPRQRPLIASSNAPATISTDAPTRRLTSPRSAASRAARAPTPPRTPSPTRATGRRRTTARRSGRSGCTGRRQHQTSSRRRRASDLLAPAGEDVRRRRRTSPRRPVSPLAPSR